MGTQNSPQTLLEGPTAQLIPRLGYRSRKPARIQQAILAKATIGESKAKIAEDLGIAKQTVYNFLSQPEISQHVSELRSDMVLNGDLVKSAKVLRRKLNKGSESAATTILKGFNVLQSNPKVEINIANFGAQNYAQRMAQRHAEQNEAITLESSENTTISSAPSPDKP